MKHLSLPDTGFSLSWKFYAPGPQYENYPDDSAVTEGVLTDLSKVFSICARHELFYPVSILDNDAEPLALTGSSLDAIIEQIRQLLESGAITYEIIQINGYGYVHLTGGEKARQDNLIGIGSIRMFERQLSIFTTKSVWVPISIDKTYNFDWQVALALSNAGRLEQCLKDIHTALGIQVSPEPGETDRGNPIWQAGFRLYINPEILLREYALSPPPGLAHPGPFLYTG
jgi:hypothetical protein